MAAGDREQAACGDGARHRQGATARPLQTTRFRPARHWPHGLLGVRGQLAKVAVAPGQALWRRRGRAMRLSGGGGGGRRRCGLGAGGGAASAAAKQAAQHAGGSSEHLAVLSGSRGRTSNDNKCVDGREREEFRCRLACARWRPQTPRWLDVPRSARCAARRSGGAVECFSVVIAQNNPCSGLQPRAAGVWPADAAAADAAAVAAGAHAVFVQLLRSSANDIVLTAAADGLDCLATSADPGACADAHVAGGVPALAALLCSSSQTGILLAAHRALFQHDMQLQRQLRCHGGYAWRLSAAGATAGRRRRRPGAAVQQAAAIVLAPMFEKEASGELGGPAAIAAAAGVAPALAAALRAASESGSDEAVHIPPGWPATARPRARRQRCWRQAQAHTCCAWLPTRMRTSASRLPLPGIPIPLRQPGSSDEQPSGTNAYG